MMTDREIVQYLARAGQHVCGRVMPEQLGRSMMPEPARPKGWRGWWHWVLAAVLLSVEAKAQEGVKAETVQVAGVGEKKAADIAKDAIKIKVLPEVVVYASNSGWMGGLMYSIRVDTIWGRVADTLATIGWKRELSIYPNPVRKGMALTLSWQGMDPGIYMVSLFNVAGAAVQQRGVQVNAREQVDLIEIPASLSGGIYFLRAVKAGETKLVTRKLVVL